MNIWAVILWLLIYTAFNYKRSTFKPSLIILVGVSSSLFVESFTLEEYIVYQLIIFPLVLVVSTFYCKGCRIFLGMFLTTIWYISTNTSTILSTSLNLPFVNYFYSYEILLSSLLLLFLTEMDKNFYKKLTIDFKSGWKIILLNLLFLLTFI